MNGIILFMQFSILNFEFPVVKNFFCVSECRLGYPFVGNSFIFPSAFIYKTITLTVTFPSLLYDFLYFMLFRIFSYPFQILPVSFRICPIRFQMRDAMDRVYSVRMRESNSICDGTDPFCYFEGSVISSREFRARSF